MLTRINKYVLLIAALFISINTASANDDLKKERKIVDDLNRKYNQSLMKLDVESIISMLDDNVILMPIFKPTIEGKAEARRDLEESIEAGIQIHSASTNTIELWKADDRIYERSTFGVSISTYETRRPFAFYGSSFTVYVRQSDGSYKVKYSISNLDHNPFGN